MIYNFPDCFQIWMYRVVCMRKWNHKALFKKPDNAVLIKVWRISSDPIGVHSVKWLHLYQQGKSELLTVERFAKDSTIKGDVIEPEFRQDYTADEVDEIESDWTFVDDNSIAEERSKVVFKLLVDVDKYADDWIYENCKCDGGYSSYLSRIANRKMIKI